MALAWEARRRQLLDAYDSIHWLTLTKWFYEDCPDEQLWKDKRLWLHVACMMFFQITIQMFKAAHLAWEENSYVFIVSLTGELVIILVAFRTYVMYTRLKSFRMLYFKPEIFHCNRHRPSHSLLFLIEVMKHSRNVGLWVILIFGSFVVSLLVLPVIPPILEVALGTNKTYDELIPMYPSVNPVQLWWLRKEIKYIYDLTSAAINTIPWVGFVVIYYAVVNLIRAQHEILRTALSPATSVEDDDAAPIDMRLWVEDHALLRRDVLCSSRTIRQRLVRDTGIAHLSSEEFQYKSFNQLNDYLTFKLVYELRDTMSPALGGTVAVTVFSLGVNMLEILSAPIVSTDPLLVKLIFYFNVASFLCLNLTDLYIHCWLASEITDTGTDLMNAIYESDWYNKLKKPSQEFVLPIMMCRREIHMTAFGLISVSVETFVETVRLSYSYFTLLSRTGN